MGREEAKEREEGRGREDRRGEGRREGRNRILPLLAASTCQQLLSIQQQFLNRERTLESISLVYCLSLKKLNRACKDLLSLGIYKPILSGNLTATNYTKRTKHCDFFSPKRPQKQPPCPFMGGWINKMAQPQNGILSSEKGKVAAVLLSFLLL